MHPGNRLVPESRRPSTTVALELHHKMPDLGFQQPAPLRCKRCKINVGSF